MADKERSRLTRVQLSILRKNWSEPDSQEGHTWAFDGVYSGVGKWMGYDHEMKAGLNDLGAQNFDELASNIGKGKKKMPVVVDLMGGGYFIQKPEKTVAVVGIRAHNKDKDFLDANADLEPEEARQISKAVKAQNRLVIEADVLTHKGWKKIKEAKLPKADLLVCRPVGPMDIRHAMADNFDEPSHYAPVYTSRFERMSEMVDTNGGVLFTEVPDVYTDEEIKTFFGEVDEKRGTSSKVYTVDDKNYEWAGRKRRYAVVKFNGKK